MMLTRTTQHNWTSHSMLFIFPALPHTKPGEVWRSCCYNCQHTSVVSSGTCITDNHLLIAKNSKPGFQSVSTEIGFCSEWIRICTNMHSLSNPRNSILSKSPCLQWHQNSSLQSTKVGIWVWFVLFHIAWSSCRVILGWARHRRKNVFLQVSFFYMYINVHHRTRRQMT